MADYLVTTTADQAYDGGDLAAETADGGGLSLREALGLAAASGEAATISVDASLHTLRATNGGWGVRSEVTLNLGRVSLDGAGRRVLDLLSGADLTVNGGTIRYGRADDGEGGGAFLVRNGAALTLRDVELLDNRAEGDGGAIRIKPAGSAVLIDTLLSGNAAGGDGGAVRSEGVFVAAQTIFTGNDAAGDGGGLSVAGGTATLAAAAWTGNAAQGAGGAVAVSGGAATLDSVTIADNAAASGGGLAVDEGGAARIGNSILAGAERGGDLAAEGATSFAGGVILGEASGAGLPPIDPGTVFVLADLGLGAEDLFASTTGAPRLIASRDNIAIDAADPAAVPADRFDLDGDGDAAELLPLDAYGVDLSARLRDIGAREATSDVPAIPAGAVLVTTALDISDPDDGLTSLREAVALTNADAGLNRIVFATMPDEAFGRPNAGITLRDGAIVVTGALSIDGGGLGVGGLRLDVDRASGAPAFSVEGGSLSLSGMIIDGDDGETEGDGGLLRVADGTLALTNVKLRVAQATGNGGAIAAENSALTLTKVVIAAVRAGGDGGAIHASGGSLTLSEVSIDGARAQGDGGAIRVTGGALSGDLLTIQDARAGNDGGGIAAEDAALDLSRLRIHTGRAGSDGGGIALSGGTANLDEWSSIFGSAAARGGAIAASADAALAARNLRVDLNDAATGAGLLLESGARADIEGLTANLNRATGTGGAIAATDASLLVRGGVFADGAAAEGGAILALGAGADATLIGIARHDYRGNTGTMITVDAGGELALVASSLYGETSVQVAGEARIVASTIEGLAVDAGGSVEAVQATLLGAVAADGALEATNSVLDAVALGGVLTAANSVLGTLSQTGEGAVVATGPLQVLDEGLDGLLNSYRTLEASPVRFRAPLVVADNPLAGGADAALLPADEWDLDGDGDLAEPLPFGANGVAFDPEAPDLGAAQLPEGTLFPPSLVVTTTLDVVDAQDGLLSLREAIEAARAYDEAAQEDSLYYSPFEEANITFAAGVGEAFEHGGTIALTLGELALDPAVCNYRIDGDVDGDGSPDVTIDAQGASRVMRIASDAQLDGLILTGGSAQTGGGVLIDASTAVSITNSRIEGNEAAGLGGGIAVPADSEAWGSTYLSLENVSVSDNRAADGGGVGLSAKVQFLATDVLLSGNVATGTGGGLLAGDGASGDTAFLEFVRVTAEGNAAATGGGFAFADAWFGEMTGLTVTGNAAATGSGLWFGQDRSYWLRNAIIAGNSGAGGEIVFATGGLLETYATIFGAAPVLAATGEPLTRGFSSEPNWIAYPWLPAAVLDETPGLSLSDIFAQIDPETGGGLLTRDGAAGYVSLNLSADNPALDGGVTVVFYQPDTDAADEGFFDPAVPLPDLGAHEVVRTVLDPLDAPQIEDGAPVFADFSAGAGTVSGAAADFAGALLTGFGAGDALVLTGGLTAADVTRERDLFRVDLDGDGTADIDFRLQIGDGAAAVFEETEEGLRLTAAPLRIGEVIEVSLGTGWERILFSGAYVDPVVFALSPSLNEGEAVAARLRNVDGTGAEIRLQETKRLLSAANPGDHAEETVTLLVLEKGVHHLEGGAVLEVGEITSATLAPQGFESVEFDAARDASPAIFSQVQSFNGSDWVITRQAGASAEGFSLAMQEEEADNRAHAAEDIGWFAITQGSGSWSGLDWEAGSESRAVNGNATAIAFEDGFESAPLVLASLSSFFGTDAVSARIAGTSASGFTALALEDMSFDAETAHGHESLDWLALSGEGALHAVDPQAALVKVFETGDSISDYFSGGSYSEAGDVFRIAFDSAFVNPVVFLSTLDELDAQVSDGIRIVSVDAEGFTFEVSEQAAAFGPIFTWIAVEQGAWDVGGAILRAGSAETDANARTQKVAADFGAGFDAAPTVLAQVQSANDPDPVHVRMADADADGFVFGLEEPEAASWGSHGAETVGWLAVEQGLTRDASGDALFEAGSTVAGSAETAVALEGDFSYVPYVFAGLASHDRGDIATASAEIYQGDEEGVFFHEDGFAVRVLEDTSADAETSHGTERVDWLAVEWGAEGWGYALG